MSLLAHVPGTRAYRSRKDAILCMQTHERIQEIVDGEIGPTRAEKILEKHLDACRSCNAEADAIRELKDAISRVAGTADPDLVASLEVLAQRLCEGHDHNPDANPAE